MTLCPDLLSALGKAYSSELPVLAERMHRVSSPVSSSLAVSSCPVSGVVGTDPFSSSIRQPGSQPGGDPSLLPSLLPPPFCHSQPDHPCSWSCLQRSGGKGALVSVSSGHLLGLGAETIPSIHLPIPHFLYLSIYSHILYSQTPNSIYPFICLSTHLFYSMAQQHTAAAAAKSL